MIVASHTLSLSPVITNETSTGAATSTGLARNRVWTLLSRALTVANW